MSTVVFKATPKQREFIQSKAYLNFFMGPRGEGKTTTGIFGALAHAMEHDSALWPIRWAVIRDTWENLKSTTISSLRLVVGQYKLAEEGLGLKEPKVVAIGTTSSAGAFRPLVEFNFFGLDRPEDANRLQGFEAGGAWIEEPAPAADIASGVPEDSLIAVSSLRQRGVRPRVQITMNPPDAHHWTIKYRDDPDTIEQMAAAGIDIAFIEIPPGENPGITEEYRRRNRAIFEAMGRPDLVQRLVEGKIGYIQLGERVTPEYNPDTHDAKDALVILRRVPIMRGWDGGLNPTTVWWQQTNQGRIYIFKSIRSANVPMMYHVEHAVIPWQIEHGLRFHEYQDHGDPNLLTRDAAKGDSAALDVIQSLLTSRPGVPAQFQPGPISIDDRVGPIRSQLRLNNKFGQPVVQIDPEAWELKRALGGGWHRKILPAGIVGDIVKDEWSEHGDALGYSFANRYPVVRLLPRAPRQHPNQNRLHAVTQAARRQWMSA